MTLLVAFAGVLILGIGLTILFLPSLMRWALRTFITRRMMPMFSIVRVGFGIVFVLAAPSTRLPGFVWAFGLLMILAGVSLPIVRFDRLRNWADWWLEKPDAVIRGWSLLAILLGALLAWAGT